MRVSNGFIHSTEIGIGLRMRSLSVSETASPLSVEVVIFSGSLERDVSVRLFAFSTDSDNATEGECCLHFMHSI